MPIRLAIAIVLAFTTAARAAEDDFRADYAADTTAYRTELGELAAWCRERKLDEAAKRVDAWLPPDDPTREFFFLLRSQLLAPPQTTAPTAFEARFQQVRSKRAERLFALAKRAADADDVSTAVRWAYEAVREDADHAEARRVLGFQKRNGRWLTAVEAAADRAGSIWHPKYGRVSAEHVQRYDTGERYVNGRWISADEDARLHNSIERGWEVQTEHFRLRTNHSLEEGARLVERLESLYQVWRQLFARYQVSAAEWKRLFAGGTPRTLPTKPFPIVYFRNKAEYVAVLQPREPQIEITSGIFMNDDDTAYFFADDKTNHDSFLFHEVVHELFALSRPTTPQVAVKGNFWIVEGIACYFESLSLHDDYAALGDLSNARVAAARYRRLVDDFYVPLAEFSSYSRRRLQQDPRIARLYSQAAGLSWFLMHADAGRRREATVEYLAAIYTGKDTPTTLAERTGEKYVELDRQYRTYLENLPTSPK
jgi:hypothetical protein